MKNFILLVSFIIILTSCNSLKEAGKVIRNEKTMSTDEFLVKGKGVAKDGESRNPNEWVQLPWYLYWSGETGSGGQPKSLSQYEDSVDGLVREFSNPTGSGLKLVSGLSGEIGEQAQDGGCEAFQGRDGWKKLSIQMKNYDKYGLKLEGAETLTDTVDFKVFKHPKDV